MDFQTHQHQLMPALAAVLLIRVTGPYFSRFVLSKRLLFWQFLLFLFFLGWYMLSGMSD